MLIRNPAGLICLPASLIPQGFYVRIFTVRTRERKTKKGVMVDTYAVDCTELQPGPTWSLDKEDPLIYLLEDTEGFNPPRQWPNQPFPRVPEPAHPTDPVPEPPSRVDLRKPMAMHHLLAEYCKSLGEDPCKAFQDQSVQHLLEGLASDSKKCPVCDKVLHNVQRLKAHMRAQHMDTTPYHCAICKKYFGDAATLNLHNLRHDSNAPMFVCNTCQKPFSVKSRLTEHEKSHLPQNVNQPCRYCGEVIKERKNLKQHEDNCKENPNKAARVQCPYCPKNYQRMKDLNFHVKTKHADRFPNWKKDYVPPTADPQD